MHRVGTGVEARYADLALTISRKLISGIAKIAFLLDILAIGGRVVRSRGLNGKLYALNLLGRLHRVNLDELECVSVVTDGVGHGLALAIAHRIVGIDELDAVLVARFADNDCLTWIKLSGILNKNFGTRREARDGSFEIIELYGQSLSTAIFTILNFVSKSGSYFDSAGTIIACIHLNGSIVSRQASGQLIVELVVIGVERGYIFGDGAGQLILNILANL